MIKLNKQADNACLVCGLKAKRVIQKTGVYSIKKCIHCGLVHVDPLPSVEMHKGFHGREYFYRYYGCSIDSFYSQKDLLFRREIEIKQERIKCISRFCKENGKLLDVGTGQGLFPVLAKKMGWDAFATDISEYVCHYLDKNKDIKMSNGHFENCGFPPDFFDVITMWHILEHTYNPYKTLLTAKRVLKKGGNLFIAVPNTHLIELFIRKLINKPYFRENADEWHFYGFTPRALTSLLKKVGFKIKEIGCEYYAGSNQMEKLYSRMSNKLLRSSGINFCKTILVHAVN